MKVLDRWNNTVQVLDTVEQYCQSLRLWDNTVQVLGGGREKRREKRRKTHKKTGIYNEGKSLGSVCVKLTCVPVSHCVHDCCFVLLMDVIINFNTHVGGSYFL